MQEKEFGFIITQGISRKMTKAKVTEKLTNFLTQRKQDLPELAGIGITTHS